MSSRTFVMADIHGEYGHLLCLMRTLRKKAKFSWKNGDILIQLGDRSDRGKESYRVNEWFRKKQKKYPKQVICLLGNHEDLLLHAASTKDTALLMLNGGSRTIKSYQRATSIYGKHRLGIILNKVGHYQWIKTQPLYFEKGDWFFCHAPIPRPELRTNKDKVDLTDRDMLLWSYHPGDLNKWVDPEPFPGKKTFYGHIKEGLTEKGPADKVRVIGNSYVLDTGCGCGEGGILSCMDLDNNIVYNSLGKSYKI